MFKRVFDKGEGKKGRIPAEGRDNILRGTLQQMDKTRQERMIEIEMKKKKKQGEVTII